MFRGKFLLAGLVVLLIIGGVTRMGRSSAYQQGFMQGYYAGQQADGADGAAPAPFSPYGGGYPGHFYGHGWGFSPFGFIGMFFKGLLFFLFFGWLIRRFIFGRHHHCHHGPWKHGWHHGGKPFSGWDGPVDDTVRKA